MKQTLKLFLNGITTEDRFFYALKFPVIFNQKKSILMPLFFSINSTLDVVGLKYLARKMLNNF